MVEAWAPTGGGIRSWTEAKAAALEKRGDARHVLVVPGPADRVVREGVHLRIELAAPPIPGCAPYRFLFNRGALADLLRRLQPDVVEAGSQYLVGPVVRAWRRETGGILCGFLHTDLARAYVEPWARRLFGNTGSRRLGRATHAHQGRFFRRVDLSLAATPQGVAALEAMGAMRPHLLPLGVDLALFHPSRRSPAVREAFVGRDPEARLLVFLGRLDGEKRVPLLLDAFSEARKAHPSLHLLLVGDGPLRGEILRRQLRTPGLHLRPWVASRPAVATLLASADAYVTAGPHETFGLSVLEAQACGLPIAGVRAGALAERIGDASGWLVPPDDARALSRLLSALASLPLASLRERGRGARASALAGGGWEATFHRLFALYGMGNPPCTKHVRRGATDLRRGRPLPSGAP